VCGRAPFSGCTGSLSRRRRDGLRHESVAPPAAPAAALSLTCATRDAATPQDFQQVSFSNKPGQGSARGGKPGGTPRGPGSAATSSGIAAAALEADSENLSRELTLPLASHSPAARLPYASHIPPPVHRAARRVTSPCGGSSSFGACVAARRCAAWSVLRAATRGNKMQNKNRLTDEMSLKN
jgi:hypothetical protein